MGAEIYYMLGGTLLAVNLIGVAQDFRAEYNRSKPAIHAGTAQPPINFNAPIRPNIGQPTVRSDESERALALEQPTPPLVTERMLEYVGRIAPFAAAVWAVGALMFLGVNIVKYRQYRRLIMRKAIRRRGIDCPIPVVVSPAGHTPMLIGLVSPVIVLPNMHLGHDELDVILTHELLDGILDLPVEVYSVCDDN